MQIDSADRSTPDAIRKELGRFGGLNPYNRANWRLVIAEQRLCRRGGVFKTMPLGDSEQVVEVDPRTFEIHRREVKPLSVVTGFRDVPKYPVKGWILERWFPASKYGTQNDWERVKSSDGVTPMMGPYPHEGDYFMLAGPFERMPEIGDLKTAISMHIREEEASPVGYAQMLLNEINEDRDREDRAMKKAQEDLAHFFESEVEPILRGTSLEAQRIRNEMQEAIGDRSHLGVM